MKPPLTLNEVEQYLMMFDRILKAHEGIWIEHKEKIEMLKSELNKHKVDKNAHKI